MNLKMDSESIVEYYSVYHIKREGMDRTEGYIGVSKQPKRRFQQHRNNSDNPHLNRALCRYSDITMDIILECTKNQAYFVEGVLRSEQGIGWNLNKGGDCPPSAKGKTKETHQSVANMAEKLTGRTKLNDSGRAKQAQSLKEYWRKKRENKDGN